MMGLSKAYKGRLSFGHEIEANGRILVKSQRGRRRQQLLETIGLGDSGRGGYRMLHCPKALCPICHEEVAGSREIPLQAEVKTGAFEARNAPFLPPHPTEAEAWKRMGSEGGSSDCGHDSLSSLERRFAGGHQPSCFFCLRMVGDGAAHGRLRGNGRLVRDAENVVDDQSRSYVTSNMGRWVAGRGGGAGIG